MYTIPEPLQDFIRQNLTRDEADAISKQFKKSFIPNRQVLWTGMTRDSAQRWADSQGMQTLTTAMGPYMDCNNQLCPKREKTAAAWTKYIHGASAIFALCISDGSVVTVLSSPPPERFHPSGNTSFQTIEKPIITGSLGNRPVGRIEAVHPVVPAAQHFLYQLWPEDDVACWIHQFGLDEKVIQWRPVARRPLAPLLETSGTGTHPRVTVDKHFAQRSKRACQRHYLGEISIAAASWAGREVHEKGNGQSGVRGVQLLHAEEKRALEAEMSAEIRAFGLKRKRERRALQEEEVASLKGYKGRKKSEKRELIKQYKKMRVGLLLRHKRERESVETEAAVQRKSLKERHRNQLARLLQGNHTGKPLSMWAKSQRSEGSLEDDRDIASGQHASYLVSFWRQLSVSAKRIFWYINKLWQESA